MFVNRVIIVSKISSYAPIRIHTNANMTVNSDGR